MLRSKEKISIWKKPMEKADKFPGAGEEGRLRVLPDPLGSRFLSTVCKGFSCFLWKKKLQYVQDVHMVQASWGLIRNASDRDVKNSLGAYR
jgi:hypothetical protein